MKLKMLETRQGSPNGVNVVNYSKDNVYEIPEGLANVFLSQGWAEKTIAGEVIEVPVQELPIETKAFDSAPMNKKIGKKSNDK